MCETIDLKYDIFFSNLVVFATIETVSNKKGKKKFLVKHNQECKKKKNNNNN